MQTVFESLIGASVGCAVWSFVRSSCEQPRDKDRGEPEGRGQGRQETKDRIEEKKGKKGWIGVERESVVESQRAGENRNTKRVGIKG